MSSIQSNENNNENNIEIGARIRELREMKHYTRESLAEKVHISAKFLYEIEAGKKGFSAETLCKLAEALSVSCDYIMMGEEKEHRGMEKTVSMLESLGPKKVSRMQELLQILSEMCDVR